ncbi:MAG: polyprenyl synthetase family protein [Clostridiales bacterium]|nr:polyprenyl synthetase family protein [Clostridiales bacterium]
MDIAKYFSEKAGEVNACLDELLPRPGAGQMEGVLFEAMRYSVFAGGKRLRPGLFFAVLRLFEMDDRPYLPFACGLEMIHTYSLIHDDLPAMDDDDLRRGRPTSHKVFGEAQAILAGDALLTHAFNAMLQTAACAAPERLLAAVDYVARQSGAFGMVAGQCVDIVCEGRELGAEELRYIHERKTGALFCASIAGAALLAGAREEEIADLTEYALKLGLVFQIADDILDEIGDGSKLGKPVGSDKKNHKTTYISLMGLEEARRFGEKTAGEAEAALQGFGARAELLRLLPRYFLHRDC